MHPVLTVEFPGLHWQKKMAFSVWCYLGHPTDRTFSEAREDPGTSIRIGIYVFHCGILPEVELKGMDNIKFYEQS